MFHVCPKFSDKNICIYGKIPRMLLDIERGAIFLKQCYENGVTLHSRKQSADPVFFGWLKKYSWKLFGTCLTVWENLGREIFFRRFFFGGHRCK